MSNRKPPPFNMSPWLQNLSQVPIEDTQPREEPPFPEGLTPEMQRAQMASKARQNGQQAPQQQQPTQQQVDIEQLTRIAEQLGLQVGGMQHGKVQTVDTRTMQQTAPPEPEQKPQQQPTTLQAHMHAVKSRELEVEYLVIQMLPSVSEDEGDALEQVLEAVLRIRAAVGQ